MKVVFESMFGSTQARVMRVAAAACVLLVAGTLAAVQPASAAVPSATLVDLGSAASYSVLAGTGVTNTGAATVLAGDLGLSSAGVITGFPPGTTKGAIHDKDVAAEAAEEDRQQAYDAAAAQTGGTAFAGDQAGVIFKPGVYTSGAAVTNSGTMTLDADGDSSAVFVFQVGAAFSSAAASKIVLTDGALANNVYWQVLGAVSFGAGAKAVGTFLGAAAITFGEGASIKGRALTSATVGLANSPLTQPKDDLTAPIVTINGGASDSTNDTTPAISGTTDEPAGATVTVTVAGQTLTSTTDVGGLWSVGADTLAEGSYDVTASIADASQNIGTAVQVLTVDTTRPAVTIEGGANGATRDTTPTISGTTDEPAGTTVTVAVAGQRLTTTSGVGGSWRVTAATLTESAHSVVASVGDVAGNTGSATQVLSVDLTTPVVTIEGGRSRTTKDTSPWTYGTTGEKAGTEVDVAVGGQHLTATVISDGTWSVSARTLPAESHQVVASITDAAGNTGTDHQQLTIGHRPADHGARYQPDGAIRRAKGSFVGAGTYGSSADQRQTARLTRARSATFEVRVTNRGDSSDTLALRGTSRGKKFAVTYRIGGKVVTRQVAAGTYRTVTLKAGASVRMVVTITRTAVSRRDDRRVFEIRVTSGHASTRHDTVAAVVRR